ncbi:isoamyl acetate-hydrolyzing esterase 1 homolog isoform X2 [Prionailurus viverrinus]|uniref:isoamyl acetate-hydrolyzing esterase 1 homolog isoform X2 n=1 Tax=Prionailurus viverrinus TaxID=61388 RepID=UPI001FF66E40|nr:isoamyl acetate-hydrolyzing esterase 1 homolog isoform X2 [Prionailurus viverrinus]
MTVWAAQYLHTRSAYPVLQMRSGAGECSDSSRPRPGSDKAEFTALRQFPRENREAWYKLRRGRAPPFPRSLLQRLTARPVLAFPRGAPLVGHLREHGGGRITSCGFVQPVPCRKPLEPVHLCFLCWSKLILNKMSPRNNAFSFQQGGWGASLADKLVRKCDVLNRGFSGYNTRWAKIILPRLIKKGTGLDSPVAVTIFFGANDSALKDENPKQHVPLDEYVANLKGMVRYLKSVDVPEHRIVLISPPPLCEAAWERECLAQGCKLNRLNLVVGEYAGACLQVARDCGTDVLDLWTLMQKDGQVQGLARSCRGREDDAEVTPLRGALSGTSRPFCQTDCTCPRREMSFCSPTFGL